MNSNWNVPELEGETRQKIVFLYLSFCFYILPVIFSQRLHTVTTSVFFPCLWGGE